MSTPISQTELQELLHALCNSTLSEPQRAALNEALLVNPEARNSYLEFMEVEAELYAKHEPLFATFATDAAVLSQAAHRADSPSIPGRSSATRRWRSYLTIAASLLAVATLSSLGTITVDRYLEIAGLVRATSVESSEISDPTIAQITWTQNCRWTTPTEGVGFGADLKQGQHLELAAGLTEVTFNNGVRVILEGPASLDLNGETNAHLHSGRLAADVPANANGFRLCTARFEVTPRDVELGLMANVNGVGEVHVFRGLVQARVVSDSGTDIGTECLDQGEGVRVWPASSSPTRIEANGDIFVRSLFSSGGPDGGLYAYDGFDYAAGPLSWQNGGFGWGGPWADIEQAKVEGEVHSNCVAEGNLDFPGVTPLSNHAVQIAQHNRIRRSLSTSIGGVFDAAGLVENRDGHRLIGKDGRSVYISFLQRVNKTNDVFYGFEMHRGDGNGNRVLSVGNGADGSGYGVTSNYNSYGPTNYPSLGEEDTKVNLVVVRIDYGAQDFDEAIVYRNPESLLDEAQCRVIAKLQGNFAFDRISLGNFDGTKTHEIDEIRIGTVYRAVTGQRGQSNDKPSRRVAATQRCAPRNGAQTGQPLFALQTRLAIRESFPY